MEDVVVVVVMVRPSPHHSPPFLLKEQKYFKRKEPRAKDFNPKQILDKRKRKQMWKGGGGD